MILQRINKLYTNDGFLSERSAMELSKIENYTWWWKDINLKWFWCFNGKHSFNGSYFNIENESQHSLVLLVSVTTLFSKC
jgi:hypothetical protein